MPSGSPLVRRSFGLQSTGWVLRRCAESNASDSRRYVSLAIDLPEGGVLGATSWGLGERCARAVRLSPIEPACLPGV